MQALKVYFIVGEQDPTICSCKGELRIVRLAKLTRVSGGNRVKSTRLENCSNYDRDVFIEVD